MRGCWRAHRIGHDFLSPHEIAERPAIGLLNGTNAQGPICVFVSLPSTLEPSVSNRRALFFAVSAAADRCAQKNDPDAGTRRGQVLETDSQGEPNYRGPVLAEDLRAPDLNPRQLMKLSTDAAGYRWQHFLHAM